ncbi:hypothetical protein HK102_006521 [Quaeritorhiza haematococci]|nr:hypothetical protein HK102_006521 [Quaeritorhiza haematococci]
MADEQAESDVSFFADIHNDATKLLEDLEEYSHEMLMSEEADQHGCFIEIRAGAGGAESCDWVAMLSRMYLRWALSKSFKASIVDEVKGEASGLKSCILQIDGEYAYGWCCNEAGVHRLVRISKHDSQCQNERSQHQNKATAMKMLRARLYERELRQKQQEKANLRAELPENAWGSQIRSYVLQPYQMIKDLRTGYESSAVDTILDGDIDEYVFEKLAFASPEKNVMKEEREARKESAPKDTNSPSFNMGKKEDSTMAKRRMKRDQSAVGTAFEQADAWHKDPLFSAVYNGDYDMLVKILENPTIYPNMNPFRPGPEGETILHMAVLFSNPADDKYWRIAEYLMERYPQLMELPYKGDRYKGETCLHIAACKGDLRAVKYLVEVGKVDINKPRANGYEFRPDDYVWEADQTLPGLMYYGETVLSFAACARQPEVVDYLLSKGANPGVTDSYGNNVLHMLHFYGFFESKSPDGRTCYQVLKEFLDNAERNGTLDRYLSNGVHPLQAKNNDGLTPFLVAVQRGHVKVLDELKEPLWSFGMASAYIFPVTDIDTWQDPSLPEDPNRQCALRIAVDTKNAEMVNHEVLSLALRVKWELYAKQMFLAEFFAYGLLMIALAVAIAYLPADSVNARKYYTDPYGIPRMVMEGIVALGVIIAIFNEVYELFAQGIRGYFTSYGKYQNIAQWSFILILGLSIVCRWMNPGPDATTDFFTPEFINILEQLEMGLMGVGAIIGCLFMLNFAKGFPNTGPLVEIFWRMLTGDMIRWIVIYSAIYFGFTQAFYLQMNLVEDVEDWNTPWGAYLWVLRYLFGDSSLDDLRKGRTPAYAVALFICHAVFTSILLLNLLIALLNNSFTEIFNDAEKQWLLGWANLVLEKDAKCRNLSPSAKGFSMFAKHRLGSAMHKYDKEGNRTLERWVFIVFDRLENDKRIPQKLVFSDLPDYPNEVRVPKSVWASWSLKKHSLGKKLKQRMARTESSENLQLEASMSPSSGFDSKPNTTNATTSFSPKAQEAFNEKVPYGSSPPKNAHNVSHLNVDSSLPAVNVEVGRWTPVEDGSAARRSPSRTSDQASDLGSPQTLYSAPTPTMGTGEYAVVITPTEYDPRNAGN